MEKRQKNSNDNVNSEEIKKLFLDNEAQSNLLIGKINLVFAALLFIYTILLLAGFFDVDVFEPKQVIVLTVIVIINAANGIITFLLRGTRNILKYINIFALAISISLCNLLFSYMIAILTVLPVVLSSRYFLKWFTRITAIVVGVLWFVSTYVGEYFNIAWVDLNFYELPEGTVITILPPSLYDSIIALGINTESRMQYIWVRFFIELSFFVVVSLISVSLAECGRKLIYKMAEERLDKMRLSTELNIASKIQLDMLPNSFDLKQNNEEFSLSALMSPAKEVGGDFYDFFYTDENHLALVIADVSGKGVPAALFMANAKTVIKSIALNTTSKSTSEILRKANNVLCEGNDEGLFVTVWMGIIDVQTGKGIATNAGHENPLVKRRGNVFEIIKYKHSMALGVLEDVNFEEHEFELQKEDVLLVYTDGVPEAVNKGKEQFGEERMIMALNNNVSADINPQKTIESLKDAAKAFANGAEQFDDITILCYEQKA